MHRWDRLAPLQGLLGEEVVVQWVLEVMEDQDFLQYHWFSEKDEDPDCREVQDENFPDFHSPAG